MSIQRANDAYMITSNCEPLDHESSTTTQECKSSGGHGECKAHCNSEAISREKSGEGMPSKSECGSERERRTRVNLEKKSSIEVEVISDQCSR